MNDDIEVTWQIEEMTEEELAAAGASPLGEDEYADRSFAETAKDRVKGLFS